VQSGRFGRQALSGGGAHSYASESDDAAIADATAVLDGQILQSVLLAQGAAETTFEFDLGAKLATSPYGREDTDEQWNLYAPGQLVLTLRADAQFRVQIEGMPGLPEMPWKRLW
jgi:hypothetical protein